MDDKNRTSLPDPCIADPWKDKALHGLVWFVQWLDISRAC
jgi:hypothetical protein